ncbi:MAG: hypothetical protein IK093_06455 [Ruminiclostridium sp.]|nr:hypothetical protein [Ruminiclostridium sp.]
MKKKTKAYKIVTVALFAAMLAVFPVMTFLTLPEDPSPFSENENRRLATFPEVSVETYKSEKLMTGIEKWFSDRFFGREQWIKLRNGTERLIGKVDIKGVFTADDRMMQIWEGFDEEFISKNLKAMNKFAERNPDTQMYFLLAPTSQEVYSDLFPSSAPVGSQSELLEFCHENLDSVQTINVIPTMKAHAEDYIYYRTDHHWTSFGAYLAYYDAAKVMGFKPSELNEYDIEHASSSFRGTLYSKTLDDTITPDIIDYYHLKTDHALKMTVNDGGKSTSYDSLYFREYLDVKDKYSSFTGPNVPYLSIETGSDGPALLIFKDSYANSLIPFLTAHFSRIDVFDLRLINDLTSSIRMNNYDSVMFVYNAITFSEGTEVRKLNMG